MKHRYYSLLLAAAGGLQMGCSGPERNAPAPAAKAAKPEPPKITQLYATKPKLAKGEKALLCYGVENAASVWLSPPREELSTAQARCVEITPAATTTYTLDVEGPGGKTSQDLKVEVGPAPPPAKPRARIVEVTVSSLSVKKGSPVSICYQVERALSVRIDPIHYRGGPEPKGCVVDQPAQTTSYAVIAQGAGGQDTERLTVKVE